MTWRGLADECGELHAIAPRLTLPRDAREAAAALAIARWGVRVVHEQLATVNVGALALAMRDRLVVHQVTSDASQRVHETDLHTLPGEPPRLLRGPWILEVRRPDRQVLFGATASLGGYELDGALYLVGLDYPDGVRVARWVPRWEEREIVVPEDHSPLIDDVDAHHEWAQDAARYAVVLGILLDAEGTPLRVGEMRSAGFRAQAGVRSRAGWVVRRVHLDERRRRASVGEPGEGTAPEGRIAATVAVTGHLKRQAYGPGRSQRRWIYVESYEARRWVAPRPLRIVVDR